MTQKAEQELLKTVLNAQNTEITEYPLYYSVDDMLIRENKDGKKYIVKFDKDKKETILGEYYGSK